MKPTTPGFFTVDSRSASFGIKPKKQDESCKNESYTIKGENFY
jgi:hypothetical protein